MTTTYELYTNENGTPKAVEGKAPAILERVEALETSVESLEETLDNDVVTSVNSQTGDVTVDVGVTSFNGSKGAVTYSAPVSSVNGKTGAVKVNVGVTSVNGKTGAVTGLVTSVNGTAADASGNVTISVPNGTVSQKHNSTFNASESGVTKTISGLTVNKPVYVGILGTNVGGSVTFQVTSGTTLNSSFKKYSPNVTTISDTGVSWWFVVVPTNTSLGISFYGSSDGQGVKLVVYQ